MPFSAPLARTPSPPYYAVIFTSRRTEEEDRSYNDMADRMVTLASEMPGFLGVESVRCADGLGITVSYWESEDSIREWKTHSEHQVAQETGKNVWYADYAIRVARVERAYGKIPEQARLTGRRMLKRLSDRPMTPSRFRSYTIMVIALLRALIVAAYGSHDSAFWKAIKERDFAVPEGESVSALVLELADLAADTDPILRDECGYEILAVWVYRKNLLNGKQLEVLRRKLLPAMTFHIGESDTDTVFRRSFSALYMSVLAAQDLQKPFLSSAAFKETLDSALRCYTDEKDLRGYVPKKGWAHATAHVADLLKFLARNPQLSLEDQRRIVAEVSQRCRTVPSVFAWGEEARIAAALLSVVDRKDFNASIFDGWFRGLIDEHQELWKGPTIDTAAYVSVRTQANVLAHLAAKIASQENTDIPQDFRKALNAILTQIE